MKHKPSLMLTVQFHWRWFRYYPSLPCMKLLHACSPLISLPMLRLRSSKHKDAKIALIEYSQMSTHVPESQSFFRFLRHFLTTKLVTSSIRVNPFTLRAAKKGLKKLWKYLSNKTILRKIFEGEILIRSQITNLLQIFCEP